ncbi:arginine deiminase [Proteinivorax hydrogeniformans]|uniref:arginine deiminase n=1 Tax=Proteinivorax hydrogeniformans TaxID=1826727 RepID=A0AAU8HTP7_9FIRM
MPVNSDIGQLKKVIVHRPSDELEYLTPKYLEQLLFDEIPWLGRAQKEHDLFVKNLETQGIKVFYLTDLIEEVLQTESLKEEFIIKHLNLSHIANIGTREAVHDYLMGKEASYVVRTLIRGLKKDYVQTLKSCKSLSDQTKETFPFYLAPIPSMYFSRDQSVTIGKNMMLGSMLNDSRQRETLFMEYITKYHPKFSEYENALDKPVPRGLEGGDVIVASKDLLIIGLSERTTEQAIETVAQQLLIDKGIVKEVLVLQIPAKRAYMHLDTVFNMVDRDKFILYPGIKDEVYAYRLTAKNSKEVEAQKAGELKQALSDSLGYKVNIIHTGGDDPITAAREQWGDSTNTLALAPGTVIAYNRNTVTNDIMRKNGIEVIEFEGSELVRGRGGPRCMSMPFDRLSL